MSDTWITDMRHYLDDDGHLGPLPATAMSIVLFLGSIIEWMTIEPPTDSYKTNVCCRRSPGRSRCLGSIHADFVEEGAVIRWSCPFCGDNGQISGWQGTQWDRSSEVVNYYDGLIGEN